MTKHIKVNSISTAWEVAASIFPTDYQKDEESSKRAGYPIYKTTSTDESFSGFHISDLNTRLEVSMGAETAMIWVEENEEETFEIVKGDWQVFRFEYPVMKDGKPVLDENRKRVTKGRMLDFMGFQFHHDRTTIRKSNIESARRKANHISKQDKISWYNASVMLSYMGLFKHTDTYNYYIEYIKPKINVKKLKRIVSKHSRKENEQHDRLEKGDRNTAGTSGGNRQDIVSVNGLSA